MRVRLDEVQKGRRGEALGTTSPAIAAAAPTSRWPRPNSAPRCWVSSHRGHAPDAGTVALDDATDRRARNALRRRVALVDAPDVSEPAPNIAVAGVVAEELMFAGLASDPLSARRWLDEHDLRSSARLPIADLAPAHRLRILLELASARPGVDGLVLVSPDRHGGDPASGGSSPRSSPRSPSS
jgi:hypothetical protein